jgi:hypothetical protein
MSAPRSALLAAVERSPQAEVIHDRAAWVGLFTPGARVEDPVGARPHVGLFEIGRFYDTFIAPREIVFHPDLDIVSDTTVIRDLQIEVAMGSTVTMFLPAVVRYDLRSADGDWKIERLRAYWELPAMALQFVGKGLGAAGPALQLSRALLHNQGLRGTAGFALGFRGARLRGKRTFRTFLEAISAGDELGARRCLAPGAAITQGERNTVKFGAFSGALGGVVWTKMIAAGPWITASLRGRTPGVLIAELGHGGGAITRLLHFAE